MKSFKQFINESENTHPWVEPQLKHIKHSVTTLHKDDSDYKKTYSSIKSGTIKKIPHSYFKKEKHFEPFTKRDLKDKNLEPRVKKIIKGFSKGKIPMILGTQDKHGKIDIYDGRTRAGVAIALKQPIYAKLAHRK